MHTLVYSGLAKYDKNHDITSLNVNTAAPWSYNLEATNTIYLDTGTNKF